MVIHARTARGTAHSNNRKRFVPLPWRAAGWCLTTRCQPTGLTCTRARWAARGGALAKQGLAGAATGLLGMWPHAPATASVTAREFVHSARALPPSALSISVHAHTTTCTTIRSCSSTHTTPRIVHPLCTRGASVAYVPFPPWQGAIPQHQDDADPRFSRLAAGPKHGASDRLGAVPTPHAAPTLLPNSYT